MELMDFVVQLEKSSAGILGDSGISTVTFMFPEKLPMLPVMFVVPFFIPVNIPFSILQTVGSSILQDNDEGSYVNVFSPI